MNSGFRGRSFARGTEQADLGQDQISPGNAHMGPMYQVQQPGSSNSFELLSSSTLQNPKERFFDGTQTEIIVEDIPSGVDSEILEMLFSSRRLKSCTVVKVDFNEEESNAVIRFDNPEDVKAVMDNRPIKIKKKELSIQINVPTKLCTVVVRGPSEIVMEENKETFELYFENEKRSGGGDIVDISFKSDAFYIIFNDSEVAKRVAERSDHRILRKQVKVELLVPRRSTKISHINESNVHELTVMESEEHREEIDQRPLKTVKVRGVSKLNNRDNVKLYFESVDKSGDTEIEEIFNDDEDEDVIYIRYKDESVARKVAERQHTTDGHFLDVSLYVPPITPPNYTNKMLIEGLNPRITFSILELFIEARAGMTLVYMIYHVDRQDTALAIVDGDREMHVTCTQLEDACKSKPLEGSILRFSPVPMSNCVHVSNIRSMYTEDTIVLYFENIQKSNGGPVEKVQMFVEQQYCIVYFKDYNVVENVLSKKHTLDGKTIFVKLYIPSIGKTDEDIVGRRIKMPKPFEINTNSNQKKFLKMSVIKQALQTHMSICHASIKWPTDMSKEDVEIFCTVSENVEDFERLAANWKEKAKTTFEDFMNKLNMDREHEVKVEIHQKANEVKLTGLNIMVNGIQVEAYPIHESFPNSGMNTQTDFLEMFTHRFVKENILQKLNRKGVITLWDSMHGKLNIVCKRNNMFDGKECLSKLLSTGRVQLKPELGSLFRIDIWGNILKEITLIHQGKLLIEVALEAITLICTDEILSAVLVFISDFLQNNTVCIDKLCFEKYTGLLLQKHCIQDILGLAKSENVVITIDETELKTIGSQANIKKFRQKFDSLAMGVKKKEHMVTKPGISDYIYSEKGRGLLITVEHCYPVIIGIIEEVDEGTHRKPSLVAARTPSENASSEVNSVCLIIYAKEESDIRKAIAKLEQLIEEDVASTRFTDSIIERFDDQQWEAMRRIADNNNVEFIPTNEGFEIMGMMENVHTASTIVNIIIRDAIGIEYDIQAAQILKDVVQWYYIEVTDEGDELNKFEINLNYQIEKAFLNLDPTFIYREDSVEVVVDFNTLQEYEKGETDDNKKTKIVRKDVKPDKLDEIPQDWKDMKGNLLVHTLLATDPRYTAIATAFTASAGSNFTIQKIEMVQNRPIRQQYAAKKKQLEGQNPPEITNERFLWHGTSAETVDEINAHGFNRSYCAKTAVEFGDGVYFAVDARYSAQSVYSRPDLNGVKRMYYCGVLTGEFTIGRSGMRRPPHKPSGGRNALYDSVTNNVQNPSIFIIFNDTQAYPLYIVHFK